MTKPREVPQFIEFANMTAAILTKKERVDQEWLIQILERMNKKPPEAPTLKILAILSQRAASVFQSLRHQMLLSIGGERISERMFGHLDEDSLSDRVRESGWSYSFISIEPIISSLRTPDGQLNLDSMWRSFFVFLNGLGKCSRYPCRCLECNEWFIPHVKSPKRPGTFYCTVSCKNKAIYKNNRPV